MSYKCKITAKSPRIRTQVLGNGAKNFLTYFCYNEKCTNHKCSK